MAGRHRKMSAQVKLLENSIYGYGTNELRQETRETLRKVADIRAMLFRIDPTPERLTAWADAYGMLGEES